MAKAGEARGSYTATHAENATPPGLDVYRLRNPLLAEMAPPGRAWTVATALEQELSLGSPGQALFRTHCASCHDTAPGSIPTRVNQGTLARGAARPRGPAKSISGGAVHRWNRWRRWHERSACLAVEKASLAPHSVPADRGAACRSKRKEKRCPDQPSSLPDPATLPVLERVGRRCQQRPIPAGRARRPLGTEERAEAHIEMGVRHSRRHRGERPADGLRRPGDCRQRDGGLSMPSTRPRVRLLAVQGRRRCAQRGGGRRHLAGSGSRSAMPPTSATCSADVYAVDSRSGEKIWSLEVDDHAFAAASPAERRCSSGRLYVPVSSLEELPARAARLPVLHLPRQRRAHRRRDRQADLEDLHDPRTRRIVGKNAAGTPLWKPAGAADLGSRRPIDAARKGSMSPPATPTPSRRRRPPTR